jgi:predicted SnoaL-like aldol condensation-catalyzing enzyme
MNCSKAMDDRLQGSRDKFPSYFRANHSIQHNPLVADNLTSLGVGLRALATECSTHVHKVLGEGNFVLVVAERTFGGRRTSYYDLYRIQGGKIAEHSNTFETIQPSSEWKNLNGKC